MEFQKPQNMVSLLAKRNMKAGRLRNVVAVLAIALTAVLFTAISTVGMGAIESMKLMMQMQKGSRSDAEFKNVSQSQYEELKKADFVKEIGLRMPVGFLTNTNNYIVEFDVMDQTEADLTFAMPSHGKFPKKSNEIVTSDRALRDLGVEPEIGQKVAIEFTAHGQDYSMEMVVSGWYEAINEQFSYMITGTAFRDANPELFANTYIEDRESCGTYFPDIVVTSTIGLQERLDAFSRSVGGNPDDMNAGNYFKGSVNRSTNPALSIGMITAGMVFIILFLVCGYLLIYNVFDISVMQEIRRYGLYRTIGMSKKQVKKLINLQAVLLSCAGIPLGLLIGYLIGNITLPVIMRMFATEYSNVVAFASPSPVIFLASAVLTALTVLLSTRKPVRSAVTISPIEAFRYVESGTGKKKNRKGAEKVSISKMAWSNIGRNKRRCIFIIVSLMLCIVLLNCAGTVASSLDVEKQVAQMIRTDFAVLNRKSMSNLDGFTKREFALLERTMKDIAAQPGIKEASGIYKNTIEDTDVTYDFGIQWEEEETDLNSERSLAITEDGYAFALGEDGRPMCNVYGMDETVIRRMAIVEGETDPHALYEKMKQGEGILVGVQANMGSKEINEDFNFVNVGDMITVYKDGNQKMQLPVLAKAALNGDDEEIGYTVHGPAVVGIDGLYLYLPVSIYKRLYEEPSIYKYSFNVEKGEQENIKSFLNDYMKTQDTSINFMSSERAREMAEGNQTMIWFVGGVIGSIFGIVGILNLVNMLITSILARRIEFATMQSLGMTNRQLKKMLTWEGIFYTVLAVIAGLALSAAADMTFVKNVCESQWNFTFQLTLVPAVAASIVLLIIAGVVPGIVLKAFYKGSIVEKLRIVC